MKLNNTAVRILVSLIAIPVIVGICLFGKIPFLTFITIISLIGVYEFSEMLKHKKIFINTNLIYVAVLLVDLNYYFNYISLNVIVIVSALLLFITELFRNKESAVSNLAGSFFALVYVGIMLGGLIAIREFYPFEMFYERGGFLILASLISIWICDSAAFFVGTAIGKHKLFPRVSPKKSWEGAIAGFLFSVAAMITSKFLFVEFLTIDQAIMLGVIIGIFGQIGDLVESLIKRDAGVKDSSSLIPGHGGILDRFDSLIFVAPFVVLYLQFFLK